MSENRPLKMIVSRTQPRSSHHHIYKNTKSKPHPFSAAAATAGANGCVPCPWLDLPTQLINLMATQKPTLFLDISSRCVTKSWRSNPKSKSKSCKSNPLLTLPQLEPTRHHPCDKTFFPVSNTTGCVHSVGHKYIRAQNQYTHQLIGLSRAMAFRRGTPPPESARQYVVLNIDELRKQPRLLPPWDDDRQYPRPDHYSHFVPGVVIVLTGLPVPAFAYYRIGLQWEHVWKKHGTAIIDPNGGASESLSSSDGQCMSLCSGIWCRGKLYALSLQGTLAVIEEDKKGSSQGSRNRDFSGEVFGIGAVAKQGRAVPSSASFKQYRECMVESEGEVLLVFLIFGKCVDRVDRVEVYSLDFGKLEWTRRQRLVGERALFFGTNCCVSVANPWEVGGGCRVNCVYFKAIYSDDWSEYDMQIDTIRPFPSLDSGIDYC